MVHCRQDTEKDLDNTQHTNWTGWCRDCCYIAGYQTPKFFPLCLWCKRIFLLCPIPPKKYCLAQLEGDRRDRKGQREIERMNVMWDEVRRIPERRNHRWSEHGQLIQDHHWGTYRVEGTGDRSCCHSNIASSFQPTLYLGTIARAVWGSPRSRSSSWASPYGRISLHIDYSSRKWSVRARVWVKDSC